MDDANISREQIEFAGLQRVNYSKLPWEEKLTIIWAWYWRTVVIGLGIGFMTFFAIGILVALFAGVGTTIDKPILTFIVLVMVAAMGIGSWHPLINWIITSKIGDYRIVICRRRMDDTITLVPPQEPRIGAF